MYIQTGIGGLFVAGVGIPGRGVGVTPTPMITAGTLGIIGGTSVGLGFGVIPGPSEGVCPGCGVWGLQLGTRQQLSDGSVTKTHPWGTLGYFAHLN